MFIPKNAISTAVKFGLPVLLCWYCRPAAQLSGSASFQHLQLPLYSKELLVADFDLLVKSLKEAHTGLYWYSDPKSFDSLVTEKKKLLRDSLDALRFYNIVSPLVAFSREDHCDIRLSRDVEKTLSGKGLFLPLLVSYLQGKTYVLNDPAEGISGSELLAINDIPLDEIHRRLFNTFASDGFILSSKYRYLDLTGLSREYAKVIDQHSEHKISVRTRDNKRENIHLKSVSQNELTRLRTQLFEQTKIRRENSLPAQLQTAPDRTAILTFRTFSNSRFTKAGMKFRTFVDSCFNVIQNENIQNLVIDIRDNGGGSEGNEDYLFSFLTNKPYNKYKFVELSSVNFSFLDHTDYAAAEDRQELLGELTNENEKGPDGKYYRKGGVHRSEPVRENALTGKLYVLISGWTYSGGAEFATLVNEHTNAVFIGEETGGGYFGNTSGTLLELTLPNTNLAVDIPILRFVLDVKKGIFGRGVLPHYPAGPGLDEFLNGFDAEMELARKLMRK